MDWSTIDWWHVAGRTIIHLVASMGALYYTWRGTTKAINKWVGFARLMPVHKRRQLFICALFVLLATFSREAWDVFQGGHIVKSFIDYASWVAGMVFAYRAHIRLINMEFAPDETRPQP